MSVVDSKTVKPKSLRVTTKLMDQARESKQFIRVGGQSLNRRQLSSAKKLWAKPDNKGDIYSLEYRLAGKPDAVKQALISSGLDEKRAANAVMEAVTEQNFDNYPQVQRELQDLERLKKSQPKKHMDSKIDLDTFIRITSTKNLGKAVALDKEQASIASPGGIGGRAAQPLSGRVKDLEPGRIIDVEPFDPSKQSGARTVARPSGGKSKKFMLRDKLMSKSKEAMMAGATAAFGDTASVRNEVETAWRAHVAQHPEAANNVARAPKKAVGSAPKPKANGVARAASPSLPRLS